MKRQLLLSTESAIVSREAVKRIRTLITDLDRTVQSLDAAGEKRRFAGNLVFIGALDMRRHNLMDTIASLKDRLGSIEKMRSRRYGRQASTSFHHVHGAR